MVDADIYFTAVIPCYASFKDYMTNYKARGNDEAFFELMRNKWHSFLDDVREFAMKYPTHVDIDVLPLRIYLNTYVLNTIEYLKAHPIPISNEAHTTKSSATSCEAMYLDN